MFQDAQKTTGGPDHWFAIALRTPAPDGTTDGFFSTQTGNTQGFRWQQNAQENLFFRQRGDSANSQVTGTGIAGSADNLIIVSHSHSLNQTRFWINSRTATQVSQTYDTTTTDSTLSAVIYASADGNNAAGSGTRAYGFYAGNEYISDSQAGDIYDFLNTRHNRTYA